MNFSKFFPLLLMFWAAATANAQCKTTLSYLSSKIPSVNDSKLTELRQKILDTDINDVIEGLKKQGIPLGKGAEMMLQQADSFDGQLAQIVEGIKGIAVNPDTIIRNLKSRSYGDLVPTGSNALGAYINQYIITDWGQLAMRESAVQVACVANKAK